MKRIGLCAATVGLCLAFLSAVCAAAGTPQEIYDQYEALNTPENLAKEYVGGRPLPFMQQQMTLLAELCAAKTAEAGPTVVRIVDEYLARANALGDPQFQISPLKGMQLSIIDLVRSHNGSEAVFQRAQLIVKNPIIREYARGRALDVVVHGLLAKVDIKTDLDGSTRGRILVDTVIADITISQLLHAPARLMALATNADAAFGGDPLAGRRALAPPATTVPRRYAVDCASVFVLAKKQLGEKKPLVNEEQKLMLDICRKWLDEYRPLVAAESYPSDVLGQRLQVLGGWKDNKAVADLLVKNGVQPMPYAEPPAPPGPDQPKPPKPQPK